MVPAPDPGLNVPGLAARRLAADILDGVIRRKRPFDEQLEDKAAELTALPDRDRALARALATMALRRLGTLRHLLNSLLERGLPADAPRVETALLVGAAQILWLDVPDHAAVDLAVRLAQADRRAMHYAKLINAVLRRIAREGGQLLATLDIPTLDTPAWLMARWQATYGIETAREIALANGREAALDLTVKRDPEHWAQRLGGVALPTGSVRLVAHGPVPQLAGFDEGAWWVQDAAAALPAKLLLAKLFGDVAGRTVADLCAAPGGKTAQLAAAGAKVTAVDRSAPRLKRLAQNLARLQLNAETIVADVTQWQDGAFDAVLLDAPCSSTGTIRRHPDIPWLKHEADIAKLTALQHRLIAQAAQLTKPGGTLVYCTCSLEPEEGIEIVRKLVTENSAFRRLPIAPAEVGGLGQWLTADGDLRTLPCHNVGLDSSSDSPANRVDSGIDGFYAARLQRI